MKKTKQEEDNIILLFNAKGNLDDQRYSIETEIDHNNEFVERLKKVQYARIMDETVKKEMETLKRNGKKI